MTRQEVFTYCHDQYGTEPEYPWDDSPLAGVLRHRENPKWYGLVMDITADKVGLRSQQHIDVLNLKGDPDEIVHLWEMPGFAPAYHMNKKHWFTVILHQIEDAEVVYRLIDKSYELTSTRRRKTDGIKR